MFNALPSEELTGSTLVVSGDGRYYNDVAIQTIIKMAFANGVKELWIGLNGLMSTPCVSEIIRTRNGGAYGGIILTASHNPGGPTEDFGIKYNVSNGGPAPEAVTSAMFECSKTISEYRICAGLPDVDLSTVGVTTFGDRKVEVLDAAECYLALVRRVFDVAALRALVTRPDFTMLYDGMHGVAGPFARKVLVQELGLPEASLLNCTPLPDFGGGHPDPNLTYAHELVQKMGLTREGTVREDMKAAAVPDFGAAADGDADRNMILGRRFFVTPSDSVAVIAATAAECIPFFSGGLRGVARSMPTSTALDKVAAAKNIPLFEVPTGWKFFGNLMDSELLGGEQYTPLICGEESFGTGSNHIREKDGLWAVLCWLSLLADRNAAVPQGQPLVSVEDIVRQHWSTYGRNYYCRYDYEGVEKEGADKMMDAMRGAIAAGRFESAALAGSGLSISSADDFMYTDPVDGSVSAKQGLRFVFEDGSRIVFRLSGTGSVGATVRLYLEKYEVAADKLDQPTAAAMADLVAIALELSQLEAFTGRSEPTVIT